ncbi:MAG: hypothetical protein U9R75_00670 [Candidatus Thermoplasmatota archaeon]|nr:hypothetical protein [Candidatus Thermoplasmatota archaeon]
MTSKTPSSVPFGRRSETCVLQDGHLVSIVLLLRPEPPPYYFQNPPQ